MLENQLQNLLLILVIQTKKGENPIGISPFLQDLIFGKHYEKSSILRSCSSLANAF